MLSTTLSTGRNRCESRLGAGLGAGARGDRSTPTCHKQGLPTTGAACRGTPGRDVAASPIQGRNSRRQRWKRAQQGFVLPFPLPVTAADAALREGHSWDIPPGHRNQPREDKTTVKRSQGIKTLSCATLVCCTPSSPVLGNISALPAPLPAFPAGRAWWWSPGPCAGTLPGAASQGLAQVTRNGTPQAQQAAPRRGPISHPHQPNHLLPCPLSSSAFTGILMSTSFISGEAFSSLLKIYEADHDSCSCSRTRHLQIHLGKWMAKCK